jgi:hypothetical protein
VKDGKLHGGITAPDGAATVLALPMKDGATSLQLDGKQVTGKAVGCRLHMPLPPGSHTLIY